VSTGIFKVAGEVEDMKRSIRLFAAAALALTALMGFSGCVTHDREVVHDNGGYAQGYQEGYYDREHNRYWHEQAWHDCMANDVNCH
jgi:hypothetical protein